MKANQFFIVYMRAKKIYISDEGKITYLFTAVSVVSLIFVCINYRGLAENEMFVDYLFHHFDTC